MKAWKTPGRRRISTSDERPMATPRTQLHHPAAQRRKNLAHGASHGNWEERKRLSFLSSPAPEGAKERRAGRFPRAALSPLPGLGSGWSGRLVAASRFPTAGAVGY